MSRIDYSYLLQLAAPQVILLLGVLVVLFLDQALARRWSDDRRNLAGAAITAAACIAASLWISFWPAHGSFYNGTLIADRLTQFLQHAVLWLAVFTAIAARAQNFTRHIGEFFALLLLGVIGMTFMAATEDLLAAFISLELLSLTLYVLAAFNKPSSSSVEGALKYFLIGSSAAAFTLFGISILYGLAGSTNFHAIAAALRGAGADPLLLLAIVMIAAGFGFKIAAVPFHLWAPDAYQGAPAPSAAFIASGSKLASFFLFAKIFILALPEQSGRGGWGAFDSGWILALGTVALASMIFGNVAAIGQPNLRRLLAYSAIAHAGYALLGVLSASPMGLNALVYYMFTYGLAIIGLFAIIQMVEREHGETGLASLAGLSRQSPVLAFCLAIFILSLAGIPPLAGFFGKFYLFVAALKGQPNLDLLWLVIAAIAMTAVSLYYYLHILKQAYVAEPAESTLTPVPAPGGTITIAFLAVLVILFGLFPSLLTTPLDAAIKAAAIFNLHP